MQDRKRPPTTHSLRKTDEKTQQASDPRYAALYQAMKAAIEKGNHGSLTLLVSVQAELRRYHLEQAYSASAILHTAFMRGIEAIDRDKPIPYPSGWLRLTCRHIIKEKSRATQKAFQLEKTEWLSDDLKEEIETDDALCAKHQKVLLNFQRLTQLDQDILTLKVVEGLRWSAIQIRLIEMGHKKHSEAALRKRKSRALKQLKAYYHQDS